MVSKIKETKQLAVYNVRFDVILDIRKLKSFFVTFASARQNSYLMLDLENLNYKEDLRVNDIFILPCFGAGPIRSNFYHLIANRLQNEWIAFYKGFLFEI